MPKKPRITSISSLLYRRPGREAWAVFLVFLLVAVAVAPRHVQAQDGEYVMDLPAASGMPEVMELNLTEAIHLALRRNRDIESAYLNRILQRFDLGRERTKFLPNLEISPTMDAGASGSSTRWAADGPDSESARSRTAGASVVTSVSQKIPTGMEIFVDWENRIVGRHDKFQGDGSTQESGLVGWTAGVRQPLLKGGGTRYNTASLVRAALQEENNVRALRDRVISTIDGVIAAYRGVMRASQRVDLARDSLDKARKHLEDTRVLIAAGRRAASESLRAEADLAQKELDLETARQNLEDAQLTLVRRLELDSDTIIVPTEPIELQPMTPLLEDCLALALERDATYLSSLNNLKMARMRVEDVLNERRWDLDLEGSYRDGWNHRHPDPGFRQDEWRVGVALKIPLPIYGDPKYSREQPLLAARVALREAEMQVLTNRENLESEVRKAVLDVESRLKQVKLAQRTFELQEQSFQFSELKYAMGQISNTEFIQEQDNLRNARNRLNDSIIDYQNSLTSLDRRLATTLETWGVEFRDHRADLEEEYLGRKTWMLDRQTTKDMP